MLKKYEKYSFFGFVQMMISKKSNDWCQVMYIDKKLNYIWNLNLFLIDKNIHEYIKNISKIYQKYIKNISEIMIMLTE
jgi:hypothetical protein